MMGPPFDSVHKGVEFAFSNASSCGSNWPNMAPARASSGLTRLDMHAQAGQIQGVIGRLQAHEALWIKLAYGPVSELQGFAVEMTSYVVGRLPTGAHNRRLIADLILWNCGRREVKGVSLRHMAKHSNLSVWKTAKLGGAVGKIMQDIGVRAFEVLERDFSEHQWLRRV